MPLAGRPDFQALPPWALALSSDEAPQGEEVTMKYTCLMLQYDSDRSWRSCQIAQRVMIRWHRGGPAAVSSTGQKSVADHQPAGLACEETE